MKILVTGTTGFIGSHVAMHLATAGHEVVATAREPGKLASLSSVDGIRQARLDLGDRSGWKELFEGCDALVHVALGWGDEGPSMLERDTAASVALFEAARLADVKRIVYTSSTAANGEMTPTNREDRALRPTDFYGATKAATEMYARAYANSHGMGMHVLRPGYVFGEPAIAGGRCQPDTRFRTLCEDIVAGRAVKLVRHDGTQFLHARDISKVYEALLGDPRPFTTHYALSSRWRSWEWIAHLAMELAGKEVPLEIEDRGYGETPYFFDVTAIREDFGLDFDNEAALRDHLAWNLAVATKEFCTAD